MQKRWIIPGVIAAAFALAATGLAAGGGHGSGHGKKLGPYSVVTDDHGSCGNVWGTDTEKRSFSIKKNLNGTYRLIRRDRGTFLTNGGQSPGMCEHKRPHGHAVLAGMKGRFHGFLVGTISGGTFDPKAVCPADCGFTDVWIATFFGPSATFSCFTDSKACAFDYEYTGNLHQHLRWKHWSDKGKGAGSFLKERFKGDIANS